MNKCSRSTARSTTWSKLAAAELAFRVAASRVESRGSTGAGEVCAGGAWTGLVSAGEICAGGVSAGEVCAGEACAGGVCAGEVSAGEVWENTDEAQQTRESVSTANRKRNIFVCFISPMMRVETQYAI